MIHRPINNASSFNILHSQNQKSSCESRETEKESPPHDLDLKDMCQERAKYNAKDIPLITHLLYTLTLTIMHRI